MPADWGCFARKTRRSSPSKPLQRAVQMMLSDSVLKDIKPLHAIDIGCGAGRDSFYLLEHGFVVTAIDSSEDAIATVKEQNTYDTALTIMHEKVQNLTLPECHLINAYHSIPFLGKDFDVVMQQMNLAINSNGYFCGTFFGEQDSWQKNKNIVTVSVEELRSCFAKNYDILYFDDAEPFEGCTVTGELKQWHILSVIAKKKAD